MADDATGEGRVVRVWTFDARAFSAELAALEAILSPDEQARADRFARTDLRVAYVVGRAVLRRLLAAELCCRPEEVPITYGAHGKPAVRDPGAPGFNLSNSGERIAIALAHPGEVGVDVERVRGGDWLDLARRSFAPPEAEWVRTRPPAELDRAFLDVWTRKEAYVKAVGRGLGIPLQSFSVPVGAIPPERGARIEVPGQWRVFPLSMEDAHVGACVVAGPTRLVHVRGLPRIDGGNGRTARQRGL